MSSSTDGTTMMIRLIIPLQLCKTAGLNPAVFAFITSFYVHVLKITPLKIENYHFLS